MVDSSTSNSATTNRTGASGSSVVCSSGAADAEPTLPLAEGDTAADDPADVLAAGVPSGSGTGVTV
jgi:hypothetical protein